MFQTRYSTRSQGKNMLQNTILPRRHETTWTTRSRKRRPLQQPRLNLQRKNAPVQPHRLKAKRSNTEHVLQRTTSNTTTQQPNEANKAKQVQRDQPIR